MLFSGQAGAVRRIQIARERLRKLAVLGGVIALLVPLLLVDYVRLRVVAEDRERLLSETTHQRRELSEYAERMQQISDRLVLVGRLDRKLRIMTDLDPENPLPLPGIGGIEGDALESIEVAMLTRQSRKGRMMDGLNRLEDAAEAHASRLEELVLHLDDQTARLASTPSIAPARGWFTSVFGYRTSPFTGKREFHRGIDIAARKGTPILAPAAGRVRHVSEHKALGKMVIIRHGYGIETVYGHLAEHRVKPGDPIERGQTIGLMGNTGRSTGPHVHYQVQVNGVPVDPQNYMLD
jgi:murein DD-endopeptidase MepM/ murein hydrolase activator NlpD